MQPQSNKQKIIKNRFILLNLLYIFGSKESRNFSRKIFCKDLYILKIEFYMRLNKMNGAGYCGSIPEKDQQGDK